MRLHCLASILFVFASTTANAADIFVSPGDSIQAAVDTAAAGDSIHVSAGVYIENINIPSGKDGLSIIGKNGATIVSAGGVPGEEAPVGVPVDIIIDIFSSSVTISKLELQHPPGVASKRDIGVFFRPSALNGRLSKSEIVRFGTGEPFAPGSRGVFVFRATGVVIDKNDFNGNYQDHIHLPTSATEVIKNVVTGATRLGIAVIQESPSSLSEDNILVSNTVQDSISDGIQIQGDNNSVVNNKVSNNSGAGIRLCGPTSSPACVAPGGSATADGNTVTNNKGKSNSDSGILDFGMDNTVSNNKFN